MLLEKLEEYVTGKIRLRLRRLAAEDLGTACSYYLIDQLNDWSNALTLLKCPEGHFAIGSYELRVATLNLQELKEEFIEDLRDELSRDLDGVVTAKS